MLSWGDFSLIIFGKGISFYLLCCFSRLELFTENNLLFSEVIRLGVYINSLTPILYNNLSDLSIDRFNMEKVSVFLPTRKGSKRVLNKNIRVFSGIENVC